MYRKIALLALLSQEAFCLAGEKPSNDRITPDKIALRKPKFTRGISIITRSPQIDDFSPILSKGPEEKKESPTPALDKEDAMVASLLRLALSPGELQRRRSPSVRPVVGGFFVQSPDSIQEDGDESLFVHWHPSAEPSAPKPDPKKEEDV